MFGTIADHVELARAARSVIGYPALVDEQVSVGLTVPTLRTGSGPPPAGSAPAGAAGTPDPTRWVVGHLANTEKLALGTSPYAAVPALLADARLATVGELIRRAGPGRCADEPTFRRLCDAVRVDAADLMRPIVAAGRRDLRTHGAASGCLPRVRPVSRPRPRT